MYFPSLATLFWSLSSNTGLNECSMQMKHKQECRLRNFVHMVAMLMVCDVRGTLPLTAPSPHSTCLSSTELKCRNAPHWRWKPPASPVWTPHCSQAQGARRGPSMGARGSWGRPGDTVIHAGCWPPQGPGYLRSAPAAQVLCEPAAPSNSTLPSGCFTLSRAALFKCISISST